MLPATFTAHLFTRAFCSALGKEFTAARTIRLPAAPYPGLIISFGRAPVFRVRRVQFNHADGSFTLLEEKADHFAATSAAIEEWSAVWRDVGFEIDQVGPEAPRQGHLHVVT